MKYIILVLLLIFCNTASAHSGHQSTLVVRVDPSGMIGQWELSQKNYKKLFNNSKDNSKEEVNIRLKGLLKISEGSKLCISDLREIFKNKSDEGQNTSLYFTISCSTDSKLKIDFTNVLKIDKEYEGAVVFIKSTKGDDVHMISAETPLAELSLNK